MPNFFQKIFKKTEEIEEIEAYIHFIFDIDKWESRLYPLPKIEPIATFKKEVYALDKICYYLEGKPVFMLIRGIPFSLELENKEKIVNIKGYSASEIDAKINSIYVNNVFRKGSMQFKDYLVIFLTNVITGLAVYILSTIPKIAEIPIGV